MIDTWNHLADVWSSGLVRACWQGGLALAAAWGIARWCTFLSPRVVCWIWRLACLKLLVALVWATPVDLALLPAKPQQAPPQAVVSTPMFTDAPEVDPGPMPPHVFEAPRPQQLAPAPAGPSLTLAGVLLPIWLAGVAFCVFRTGRQWQAARRLVRFNNAPATGRLTRLCQEEAHTIGVRRAPRLLLSADIAGPILVGVLRPTILLPASCETTFDESELRSMLAHELAHQRRRDLAWNWLPTVVTWTCYFHPLVWLMTRGWSESQESACDEAVIQGAAARPTDYGRLLLKLAALSSPDRPSGLAVAGVLGAYRNLERRIVTIARVKPFSARRVAIAVVAVTSIGLIGVVPWRLVAQEAASAAAQDQPAGGATGTFVVKADDEPAKSAGAKTTIDPAARQAIEKLKALGANIGSSKGESIDGPLTVDLGPSFQGTGADLKLLNELPDVRSLIVDLRDAKTARQELEKLVENKQAYPKSLDRPMQDVDAAALGELKLKRPLGRLVLSHLSDAALTKMASLPPSRQLTLSSPSLTPAGWARLAKLATGVQTLTLQNTHRMRPAADDDRETEPVDDESLRSVSQVGSLRTLNLFYVDATDAGLAHLAALDKLETLTLARCPKAHGAGLANLKHLKKLAIIETPIDAAGAKAIAQLAALESLMFQPGELTAADVAPLVALTNLRSLNVTTNDFGEEALKRTTLGDAVLRASASLPKLDTLIIAGIGVSDEGLAAFKGPQLRDLWLGALNVTDRGLATLEMLKELRHLTLSGKGLTDDSLRFLAGLSALERLRVADCEIQGKGLASLAKLDQLKAFSIERAPLDDQGALALAQLPALETLSLTRTKITDKAFGSIARLSKLQSLSLGGNEITIAGLAQLGQSKSLRQLFAPRLKAPKEELAKLKKDLPGVKVVTEDHWTYSTLFAGDEEADEEAEPKISAAAIEVTPETATAGASDATGDQAQITFAPADERATSERPITVSGRATNAAGEPVAGATVYLVPLGFLGKPEVKKFVKTTTNAAGEYAIRDFVLPLQGSDPRVGAYQVYGAAPGYGLAWQGSRFLHDIERPKPGQGNRSSHDAQQVYANDKLTADLRFGPEKKLRGRFVDASDKPIANAKVKAFQCRTLTSKRIPREDQYLVKLAEEMVVSTDADGRFTIPGLPDKSVALLQISLPESGKLTVHAATADGAEITAAKDGAGIKVGDVDLKFCKARVQLLYGETENPARGASVGAALNGAEGVFVSGKANDQGIVTLALPPGEYQLGITPDKADAPIEFVSASLPLVVRDTPQEQTTIARIPAGCILEVEVVDADSGQPIPKIAISYNASPDDPNLTHFYLLIGDQPQTDKNGKLRIGVEPGKRQVAPEPGEGYEWVDATHDAIECAAGKTVSLRFKLRKQAEAKPEAKPAGKPAPKISGTWIGVEPEGGKQPAAVADPAAQKALARLKELGAAPAKLQEIGVQGGWKGTDADLKLLNDLPDLKWLYLEFEEVGAQAVSELQLKRPLENLILFGLSDAVLEKLARLPKCAHLILVQHALTDNGLRLLAERAQGIEIIHFDGPRQDASGKRLSITDEGLKQISRIRTLTGLRLSDCAITDAGLANLAALEKLNELSLDRCAGVHGAGYASLAPIKSLRRLSLFTQPITAEAMTAIAKLTQLESLRLAPPGRSFAELKPDDVAGLKKLSHLQTFEIFDHVSQAKEPLGNALLAAAGQMKSLHSLRIYGIPTGAAGVEALVNRDRDGLQNSSPSEPAKAAAPRNAHTLAELYLSPVEISDRTLTAIEKLPSLKKLGLGGSGVVSEAMLGRLAKLEQLTQLDIAGSGINDEGLAQLANLRALEILNLPDSKITGSGLAALANLKQLKTLALSNSPFDDAGSRNLRELPAVEWLYLNKTKITDKALAPIATMSKLRQVTLDDTAVTVEGLMELKDLKRLHRVSAVGLKASKEEVARLREALAKVQISLKAPPDGAGTVFSFNADDE